MRNVRNTIKTNMDSPRTSEAAMERFLYLQDQKRLEIEQQLTEEEKDIRDAIKGFAIILIAAVAFIGIMALSIIAEF